MFDVTKPLDKAPKLHNYNDVGDSRAGCNTLPLNGPSAPNYRCITTFSASLPEKHLIYNWQMLILTVAWNEKVITLKSNLPNLFQPTLPAKQV